MHHMAKYISQNFQGRIEVKNQDSREAYEGNIDRAIQDWLEGKPETIIYIKGNLVIS